jgi:hypothetical protein
MPRLRRAPKSRSTPSAKRRLVVLAVVITNDPVQVRNEPVWTPVITNDPVQVRNEPVWTPVITNDSAILSAAFEGSSD